MNLDMGCSCHCIVSSEIGVMLLCVLIIGCICIPLSKLST